MNFIGEQRKTIDVLEANNKELKECVTVNIDDMADAYKTIGKLVEALEEVTSCATYHGLIAAARKCKQVLTETKGE